MQNSKRSLKRFSELALRRKLIAQPKEVIEKTLEKKIEPEEYTKAVYINSGKPVPKLEYEDTLEREFNVSATQVPVPSGTYVTDYDGIQVSILRLSSAYMNCKSRLEWAGVTIRQMEQVLHEKNIQLGEAENKPLPKIPYFEDEVTNPGDVYMVHKKAVKDGVNRFGMILVGSLLGALFVATMIYLIVK